MSDTIDTFVPRTFRADRRLIAQLTSDPQLIRYLESLGVDGAINVPDFLNQVLALIIDAAATASSSQSTANSAATLAQQALDEASGQPQLGGLLDSLRQAIDAMAGEVVQGASLVPQGLQARLDEIEAWLLDFRPPIFPTIPAPTPLFSPTIVTVTAAYSVLAAPAYQPLTVRADATAAAFTVTLPAAPVLAQLVNVKKVDAGANAVTVSGNGQLIDGAATVGIAAQYTSIQVQFNGVSWDVL